MRLNIIQHFGCSQNFFLAQKPSGKIEATSKCESLDDQTLALSYL
jgi:hypothetical protein